MYNPVYGTVMRQGLYQPAAYIPVVQTGPPTVQAVSQNQNTRSIISFQNLQQINQRFVAATTAQIAAGTHTAAQVIVGTVQITQNLVTDFLNGNDASYKINIQSGGPPAGQNIILGLAADCMTPATAGLTPDVVSSYLYTLSNLLKAEYFSVSPPSASLLSPGSLAAPLDSILTA